MKLIRTGRADGREFTRALKNQPAELDDHTELRRTLDRLIMEPRPVDDRCGALSAGKRTDDEEGSHTGEGPGVTFPLGEQPSYEAQEDTEWTEGREIGTSLMAAEITHPEPAKEEVLRVPEKAWADIASGDSCDMDKSMQQTLEKLLRESTAVALATARPLSLRSPLVLDVEREVCTFLGRAVR